MRFIQVTCVASVFPARAEAVSQVGVQEQMLRRVTGGRNLGPCGRDRAGPAGPREVVL